MDVDLYERCRRVHVTGQSFVYFISQRVARCARRRVYNMTHLRNKSVRIITTRGRFVRPLGEFSRFRFLRRGNATSGRSRMRRATVASARGKKTVRPVRRNRYHAFLPATSRESRNDSAAVDAALPRQSVVQRPRPTTRFRFRPERQRRDRTACTTTHHIERDRSLRRRRSHLSCDAPRFMSVTNSVWATDVFSKSAELRIERNTGPGQTPLSPANDAAGPRGLASVSRRTRHDDVTTPPPPMYAPTNRFRSTLSVVVDERCARGLTRRLQRANDTRIITNHDTRVESRGDECDW